ncbi:hypothetical protein YC2023_065111 [Brassica napus]
MRMRRFGVSWWTLLFTSKWAVALEQRDDFGNRRPQRSPLDLRFKEDLLFSERPVQDA